ncbi:hypothetical protein [Sphingomicrobium arenosum]|uniref:hypothetical protein n=1 Tax=Sphingomicrobium arenosum TaxID=2233861 RepID=UPI0022400FCA|nr:hypothetical protein [Sphingomicrobium arenosum]
MSDKSFVPKSENDVEFSCQIWLADRRFKDGVRNLSIEVSNYWSVGDTNTKTGKIRLESYLNIKLGDESNLLRILPKFKEFVKDEIIDETSGSRVVLNLTVPSIMNSYLVPKEISDMAREFAVEFNIRLI